jgi:hypothetical protein
MIEKKNSLHDKTSKLKFLISQKNCFGVIWSPLGVLKMRHVNKDGVLLLATIRYLFFSGTEEEVGVLGVLDKDCKNFASIKRPWNDCDKQVELVDKIEPIPEKQKWRKEPADENGWFKFTNPETNKVLTAHKVQWLSITGMFKCQISLHFLHRKVNQTN